MFRDNFATILILPTIAIWQRSPIKKTICGTPRVVRRRSCLKKVLAMGGAGFVGSSTAAHFLERGDAAVIAGDMNDYYLLQCAHQGEQSLLPLQALPG